MWWEISLSFSGTPSSILQTSELLHTPREICCRTSRPAKRSSPSYGHRCQQFTAEEYVSGIERGSVYPPRMLLLMKERSKITVALPPNKHGHSCGATSFRLGEAWVMMRSGMSALGPNSAWVTCTVAKTSMGKATVEAAASGAESLAGCAFFGPKSGTLTPRSVPTADTEGLSGGLLHN